MKSDLLNSYINNASIINRLFLDDYFMQTYSNLPSNNIDIKSKLIHKELTCKENFIYIIDLYITFMHDKLYINQAEFNYIIESTIISCDLSNFISPTYYYDNIKYYNGLFISIFMKKYLMNIKIISKYTTLDYITDFNELVAKINYLKRNISFIFEDINSVSINYYSILFEKLKKDN